MLKIAIVDDEAIICEQLERFVTAYCAAILMPLLTEVYFSGETIIQKLSQGERYDIILLDNAINALKQCQNKRLYVKIEYESGVLYVLVKNTFNESIHITPAKEGHGIGLLSVTNTAEKYKGTVRCTKQNGIFTVNVMLYLENQQVSPEKHTNFAI